MLARGLHPAIAVVSARAVARAAAISSVVSTKGCKILNAADVDQELNRATKAAIDQHHEVLERKKARVAEAEQAVQEATEVAEQAAKETTTAGVDLSRFDELATGLTSAEEAYEAAVKADAEAARSLAAALGELDRILGQRQSASTSLDQARKSRDSRGVPEAVIQQAMNLQAALASAEAERNAAVQQADETSQTARAASREALRALEEAHTALQGGMALITSGAGAPNWGPGIPLPGLVASYRDRLAGALAASQASEAHARSIERGARSRLEQEHHDLDALEEAGPPVLEPEATIAQWANSEEFSPDDAVFADDAFHRFGAEGAARLITTLAGRGCQVIYLTEDPEVLGWAISLPHEAGGATTISAAPGRKPALVGD